MYFSKLLKRRISNDNERKEINHRRKLKCGVFLKKKVQLNMIT